MINMSKILEEFPLEPAQERISSARARSYARLRNLERQLRREKANLVRQLTKEEFHTVEATLIEEVEPKDDVPKYLSVAEVAAIMGISPQMVRRNCANKKYQGYQPSGSNGIWFVNSDTFRNNPDVDWDDFISRRNDVFARSKEVAEAAIKLQDQELEELDIDAAKE